MTVRTHSLILIGALMQACAMQGSHDANEWINGLEKGMTQEEVEYSKPEHVTVHWDQPIVMDSVTTEYDITYEDRMDFAPTPYFLVFKIGAFVSYGGRN